MFNTSSVQLDWQGLNLQLETGMIARQADGAVLATLGSTSVLCTVTAAKEADPNIDFFPCPFIILKKVMQQEKYQVVSLRERGRPSEIEILNSRLIDRPMRPLFHKDYNNETQVICTVINYDGENDPGFVQ